MSARMYFQILIVLKRRRCSVQDMYKLSLYQMT